MKKRYESPEFELISDEELQEVISAAAWTCICFFKFCMPQN